MYSKKTGANATMFGSYKVDAPKDCISKASISSISIGKEWVVERIKNENAVGGKRISAIRGLSKKAESRNWTSS
jgi:hypothetical protein